MTFCTRRRLRLPERALLPLLAIPLAAGTAAAEDMQVPLCPGLTIVTAIGRPEGDYESIKTIESVDVTQVRIRYSSEVPNTDMLSTSADPVLHYLIYRTVLTADLAAATQYEQVFLKDSEELVPGTTAIGTSRAVLQALASGRETAFAYSNIPGDDYAGLTANREVYPNYYSFFMPVTLQPGGREVLSVLVNDRPTELPAIRATSEQLGEKSEFLFLDDPANPLTLAFRIGIGAIRPMDPAMADACRQLKENGMSMFHKQCLPEGGDTATLKVTKITYRCQAPPAGVPAGAGEPPGGGDVLAPDGGGAGGGAASAGQSLEQVLEEGGRVEIYSIYFEFNSADIREESRETLDEIAAVLGRHPDWRLTIEGHTDNIASDEYNLALSQRRANAVKEALVSSYGFDAGRLVTGGFGEARPVDTNDTLDGRARNRRVELARLP